MANRLNFMRQCLICCFALAGLLATGQTGGDSVAAPSNRLDVNLNFMARGETRYGGLPAASAQDDDGEVDKSNFVIGRTRLVINYRRDWLQARVTPQHSGVWGQSGNGSFNLYESWVKMTARNGLFAQAGRVALSYDDERIIGSDDWAMASSSHDVLRVGYEGRGHKAHLILAYNQNSNVVNSGGSYYIDGAQHYKTMQTVWYHYDLPRVPLGMSLLFMSEGLQGDKETAKLEKEQTLFQYLLGGYAAYRPSNWSLEASYYHQLGHNEGNIKINAWMASGKATYKPINKLMVTVGYDYLSGDRYFAVPAGGQIGMIQHKVIKGFNTVYGSHHKFYGMMDYFYVSAYINGFTPGLQNAYLGLAYNPVNKLSVNAAYHYLATGTKLTGMGRTLGHEVEAQAAYAITSDVKLSLGLSYMKGSETMEGLKRATGDNSLRWGWLSLSVNPRIFTSKWR